MFYLITIAFVVLVFALIFSAIARSQVGAFMVRVENIAEGVAYNALALLRGITRGIMGFLVAFLVIYAAVVIAIGISTGHFWLSFCIGIIFFPLWCFLFIVSRAGILRIPYWAVTLLLIASLFRFGIGMWSELVDNSLHLRVEALKEYFANRIDKSSIKSEPYGKVFAVINAEEGKATVYDDARQPSGVLENGKPVMVISAVGKRVDVDSESMARIMIANNNGDFIGGQIAWVSVRKLDFSGGRKQPSQSSTIPPITVLPQKSKWTLCRDKDCDEVELQVIGSGEAINVFRFEPGSLNNILEQFRADRTSTRSYSGKWVHVADNQTGACTIKFASASFTWKEAEIKKETASGETVTLQMTKVP